MKTSSLKEMIRELVNKELDEMTGTGAVSGFATPYAFSGEGDPLGPDKKKKRGGPSVNEAVQRPGTVVKYLGGWRAIDPHGKKEAILKDRGHAEEFAKTGMVGGDPDWDEHGEYSDDLSEAEHTGPVAHQFEQRANEFLRKVQEKLDVHNKKSFPNFRGNDTKLSFTKGSKYWRIVASREGHRSAWGFLDAQTGDILKTAGWKTPAKGARGNIFDADFGTGRLTPYGPEYLTKGHNYKFAEAAKAGETEHSGVKHGKGAYYGKKAAAKKDSNRARREADKKAVNEGGDPYYAWRNDETVTPRAKIGRAISEINKQLHEVEQVIRPSARLKKEMGVPNGSLWKRTNNAFLKMEGRINRIAATVRNMRG